jgi:hypothetical protein
MIYRDIEIIGQWYHILSLLVFFVPFSLHVKSFIGGDILALRLRLLVLTFEP